MNIYKNKNILVTGGSGVIGRQLIKKLIGYGANVRNVDFRPQPKELLDLNIDYIQVDLSDFNSQFLFRFEPHFVFHLAADFERSTETKTFWDSNWKNNILVSRHVLQQVIKYDTLQKIVFASSYLIYDKHLYNNPNTPYQLSEIDNVDPRNLCGLAKLQTETDLEFLSHFNNIDVVSARIYRVYGRGDRSIISRWIQSILKNEEILVFGKYNSFDYILADDVAEGLLILGSTKTKEKIYNLGSGTSHSVSEVVDFLKKEFNDIGIKYLDDNPQPEASFANMCRFKNEFNWIPKTDLIDGIKLIIDYEKNK
jgi:nucleoside-diphosphate-sugar epimerase